MKITIIITTAILSTIIAVTGGYNFPETVVISTFSLLGVMGLVILWNISERLDAETKLKETIEEVLKKEVREKEKDLFKRDRKVKDTKTVKKIAKK